MAGRIVYLGLLLAAFSASLRAAAADLGGDLLTSAGTVSEVVVTATRTPTPLDELATPATIISRVDIERAMASDVGALLIGQTGIEIARNGGPGQAASIFMRGTNSNHVAVLVDGVRINPGTIAGAPLQNIQAESIERIEIIKGARSSLYGGDAIGGVINIITRAGAEHGATLYAAGGRYATRIYSADAGGALSSALSAGASLAWQGSDGFPPYAGAADRGDYLNRSATAQLRCAVSDALALRAQAWRASGHNAYSSFGFPADQDYLDASYAAGADWQAGARSAHLTLSRVADQLQQRGSPDFDRTNRDALDFQAGWTLADRHQFTIGTVLANEHTSSLSFGLPFDVGTHTQLLFAQDQLHRGPDDLLLALGHTRHETFGSRSTWNAEFGHALHARDARQSRWRLTLAAGTAFHAPDSTDRFGYGGNAALQPEFSRQAELGLHWHPATSQQLRLSVFENRIDNLIHCVPLDPLNCQERNVERARIRGVEFSWDWSRGPWQLRAAGTLQNPRNLSSGETLLRRAQRHFDAALQYQRPAWFALGELQNTGPRGDFGGTALPGYTLLDLGAGWAITPQWNLQARLENALERHYQLAAGYNTPARSLTIGMRVHLH
jgi:vitamin B12 transporter